MLCSLKTADWIKSAGLLLLLGGIYASALQYLFQQWEKNADYSYGYLILPLVFYLLWDKREKLAQIPSRPTWKGAFFFIPGLFLFWLGELGGEYTVLYFSLWLVVVGAGLLLFGIRKILAAGFPLFLLLTMFPLPSLINSRISFQLKLVSSKLGVWMLQVYGMSAYREGNVIDLGFTQLQVVDACSGLRYLLPLIIMGLLIAYFYKDRLWKKILLVVSAVPLTILTNSLRIAMTGILYQYWGPSVAEGFFHGFSGWFIFMFTLGVMLLEMLTLKRVFPGGKPAGIGHKAKGEREAQGLRHRAQGETQAQSPKLRAQSNPFGGTNSTLTSDLQPLTPDPKPPSSNLQPPTKLAIKAFLSPPQFVVATILLGATLAFSQGIEFREKVKTNKPFSEFPLDIGQWTGRGQTMEQNFIDRLDLSNYTIVDYGNPSGQAVNFYVAYYESQRKGESIHSPATCLPGSGWVFREAGAVSVPVKGKHGQAMRVNRAFMQKGASKQLAYYWFPQRGRILTNAYQLKIFAFWDALMKQRTDGALVRLITPVYASETIKDADSRLQEFTRLVVPVLNQFIPGRDVN
jgi:EpsI family protein